MSSSLFWLILLLLLWIVLCLSLYLFFLIKQLTRLSMEAGFLGTLAALQHARPFQQQSRHFYPRTHPQRSAPPGPKWSLGCRLFSRSFNKSPSESRKWEGHLRSFCGNSRARAWLLWSYFWDGTCHINQALKRLAQLILTLVYLDLCPRITTCWESV